MISNLRVWLTGLLALLVTVALIVGGIRYLFSGHDPGQISAPRDRSRRRSPATRSRCWPALVSIVQRIVG